MLRILSSFCIVQVLLVTGCLDSPRKEVQEGSVASFFYEYLISADEETGLVNVVLRFRASDQKDEMNIALPGQVKLDDKVLNPDSARLSGIYYETQLPVEDFAGEHTITYSEKGKVRHRTDFVFQPLALATELPGEVKREDISLGINGVRDGQRLQVVLIDTSFETKDINQNIPVHDGNLNITKAALRDVADGPLILELYKALKKEEKGTGLRGTLSITYSLKREFNLIP